MQRLATTASLLLTLSACSAAVSSPGETDADSVTPTTAVVTFERVSANDGDDLRTRTAAAARFVQARTAQVDDRALKLVGAAFDSPPIAGCVAVADEDDLAAGRAVELADVGSISVQGLTAQGLAASFALVPRQVPDPVGLVGGVLYYAPTAESTQVMPGARYVVHGAGSAGTPAFDLAATAPHEISDVRVAGQPVSQGRATLSPTAGIPSAVELTWSTFDAARESGDTFFVDVARVSSGGARTETRDPREALPSTNLGAGNMGAGNAGAGNTGAGNTGAGNTVRCAADASGATIPGWALDGLEGTISVHRVHRERVERARVAMPATFGASRFESTELRFDFSRVLAFARH